MIDKRQYPTAQEQFHVIHQGFSVIDGILQLLTRQSVPIHQLRPIFPGHDKLFFMCHSFNTGVYKRTYKQTYYTDIVHRSHDNSCQLRECIAKVTTETKVKVMCTCIMQIEQSYLDHSIMGKKMDSL